MSVQLFWVAAPSCDSHSSGALASHRPLLKKELTAFILQMSFQVLSLLGTSEACSSCQEVYH